MALLGKGLGKALIVKPVKDGILTENPILRHTLGICSALAVTGFVDTAIVMGIALLFVASISSLAVSFLRNIIPARVRLIAQMLIISVLVIIVHLYLRAFWFNMSQALGPYVGLIITNCLILGRCESYAMRNKPLTSFLDGFGSALGYALVLLAIALIREPLGHGSLLGFNIMGKKYILNLFVGAAPGAFLVMGIIAWIVRAVFPEEEEIQHPEAIE